MAHSDQDDDVAPTAPIRIDAASDPSPAAYRWIATLPPNVRPFHLLRQFPQFANALAMRWPSKQACRTVLYELIPGQLTNAKEPLTEEIAGELETLKSYLEKL